MSWNATVDRLRAHAQLGSLATDAYTRRLLYEAVSEIERYARLSQRVPSEEALARLLEIADPQNRHDLKVMERVRATMEADRA